MASTSRRDALQWTPTKPRRLWGCLPQTAVPSEEARAGQLITVVRHTERLDDVVGRVREQGPPPGKEHEYPWANIPPPWPAWDAPITEHGKFLAKKEAQAIRRRCESMDSERRTVVCVTSPMTRCVETAVEMCVELGCPLLVDQELCERFDELGIGVEAAARPPVLPSWEEIVEKHPNAPLVNRCSIGVPPSRIETRSETRTRFTKSLQRYLDCGIRWGVDFVLCTHAYGVKVMLHLLDPRVIPKELKVQYCGSFTAHRRARLLRRVSDDDVAGPVQIPRRPLRCRYTVRRGEHICTRAELGMKPSTSLASDVRRTLPWGFLGKLPETEKSNRVALGKSLHHGTRVPPVARQQSVDRTSSTPNVLLDHTLEGPLPNAPV